MRHCLIPLLVTCSLILLGCEPRGETRSLETILSDARSTYSSSIPKDLTGPVRDNLEKLTGTLNQLLEQTPSDISVQAQEVVEILSVLVSHAGFTSRPSFGEIIKQYESLSQAHEVSPPQIKLLVARTYHLLTDEFRGIKFKL